MSDLLKAAEEELRDASKDLVRQRLLLKGTETLRTIAALCCIPLEIRADQHYSYDEMEALIDELLSRMSDNDLIFCARVLFRRR